MSNSRSLPVVANEPRPLPVVSATPPLAGAVTAEQAGGEDELRTSNGVEGFRYSRLKGWWFASKVVIGLPLLPFWPIFISLEAKDWSFTRNYFGTLAYLAKTIAIHIRHGSYVRMLKYNFRISEDEAQARIDRRKGACTRCAKCCKQYDCIFLGKNEESQEYFCKVFGSDYWYYGTCGRYPLDQGDIDAHACPGFSFPDDLEQQIASR